MIAIVFNFLMKRVLVMMVILWVKIFQPARFGAGCYIEMALSYHQPHQHELVGG